MTYDRRSSAPYRNVAVAAASLWLLTALAAIAVVAIPGARSSVRSHLGFALAPDEGSIREFLDIAGTNGRVVLAIVLAGWGRSRVPCLRVPTDLLVGLILVTNTAFVGLAVGAYGTAALPWIIHLPVEWGALAVALALYRADPYGTGRLSVWTLITSVALALVSVGALVETYLTPQG